MSSFLNKNKFKNKSFKVATRVLVFSFFCFLVLNINFGNNLLFFDVEAKTCTLGGNECEADEKCVEINDDDYVCRKKFTKEAKERMAQQRLTDIEEQTSGSGGGNAGWLVSFFTDGVDALLLAILMAMGWIVSVAVKLFEVVINPDLFNIIFVKNGKVLYDMWSFIRDFLNIFFILILLLSAFATVFQVAKYHIINGKILLWVVLMALLVNFSWPVTRVIIDMSNVTMYFFVDEMLGDSTGITTKIGALTNISNIMAPEKFKDGANDLQTSYLIMAIITVFIFGMTLFAYAGVLLIRVIALTMLLVFSPVGFMASAFPATSKYATQWWNALFKYAFNGPILVFMLVVAIKMMEAIGGSGLGRTNRDFLDLFDKEKGIDTFFTDFATNVAFFVIPIAILWMALIVAGKTDGISGWAAKKAQGWTKNTGKWATKYGRKGMATGTDILSNQTVGRATRGAGKLMSGSRYARVRKAGDVLKDKKVTPIIAGQGVFQGGVQRSKDVLTKWDKKRQGEIAGVKAGTMGTLWDKAAIQNLENQQSAEVKKGLKDRNVDFNSMVTQAKTAKGTTLRALTETISSHNELAFIDPRGYREIMENLEDLGREDLSKPLAGSLKSKGGGGIIATHELASKRVTDGKKKTAKEAGKVWEDNFSKMKGKDLAKQGSLFIKGKDDESLVIGDAGKPNTIAFKIKRAMESPEYKQSFLMNASDAVSEGAKKAGVLSNGGVA